MCLLEARYYTSVLVNGLSGAEVAQEVTEPLFETMAASEAMMTHPTEAVLTGCCHTSHLGRWGGERSWMNEAPMTAFRDMRDSTGLLSVGMKALPVDRRHSFILRSS